MIARRAALGVVAVAGAVLLGWLLGIDALVRFAPALASMKLVTATATLLLAGAALAPRWRGGLAAAAGLLALTQLVELAWDVDLGIDELLVADPESVARGQPPGRMSGVTALGVVGAALALGVQARRLRLGQALAAVPLTLAWIAALGYALELGPLWRVAGFGSVSLPSALSLGLLGISAFFLYPDAGFAAQLTAPDAGAVLLRRLALPALVLPALTGVLGVWGQRALDLPGGLAVAVGATLNAAVFLVLLGRTADRLRASEVALADARDRLHALSRATLDAQEVERRRIANELHDELGQSLTALGFLLDRAPRQPAAAAEARELVGALTELVRGLSLELRPTMLDDLGLVPALEWLLQRWSGATEVTATLTVDGAPRRLEPTVESSAFRIVQESLTNVARHARAGRVTVALFFEPRGLQVSVTDDGVGMRAAHDRPSTGLDGMRERARLAGGAIRWEPGPDGGTRVSADLRASP